jgi:hypothetical protein
VPSGVPQGGILSPTLFVAYLEPLLTEFTKAYPDFRLQAYADDTCLLVPLRKLPEVEATVQPALHFVERWTESAGLSFNTSKTQTVVFRYEQKALKYQPSLKLHGQQLEVVEEVRYLGITLSADMRFSEHVDNVSKRTRSMLGCLRRKLGRHSPPHVLQSVYESCIRSQLDYGCCAWDPLNQQDKGNLERTQLLALRLLRNDWKLDYETELAAVGWRTLVDRRKILKLTQFYKFYQGYHDYNNTRFIPVRDTGRCETRLTAAPEAHYLELPRNVKKRTGFTQCFEFSTIQLWNTLRHDTVSLSLPLFQRALTAVRFT